MPPVDAAERAEVRRGEELPLHVHGAVVGLQARLIPVQSPEPRVFKELASEKTS